MRSFSILLQCFSILTFMDCNTVAKELYVDPSIDMHNGNTLKSLEAALDKVLEIRKNNTSEITIYLNEGEYRLKAPIKIGVEHGPIKIVGQGAEKTIIKGSRKYDLKWKKHKGDIWVAQLEKTDYFDQLYINGNPGILARYPDYNENGGHWQGHAADAISATRVKTWKNPTGAILHAMHEGEWGGFHYQVTGVSENKEALLIGGHQNNRPSKMHETYRMVENVKEELDSPGEWFLDADAKLYYWPLESQNLQNALVEGTVQKHLLELVGTAENPVSNISVSGIRFEHAQRTFMEEYEPLLRSDWTIYRGGALFLEGTKNISLTYCEFTQLGGNAIFVSGYNRDLIIKGNHIHDCGASGISFVGSPGAVRSPSFQYGESIPLKEIDTIKGPKSDTYPRECLVDDNLIYRIGRIEKQTAGVQIAMAMDITVSNNSIYDVPRAGINIGDGTWGGHILEFNDVFNTVLESGDHGAFNSWGRDRFWHPSRDTMDIIVANHRYMPTWDAIKTTVIRNNRFRCDHGWDIDLDDGSSNYHLYNNLCLNGGIKLREGFDRTIENNIMINNGFHPHVWFNDSGDVFKHNIVFTEHKDIRLQAWGKEVDYNFFADGEALLLSQKKGVDAHSIYGAPLFIDAENGDYELKKESLALAVGFKAFDMRKFGVRSEKLKALAKKPETPKIFLGPQVKKATVFEWLGARIKAIETIEERSAAGLNKTAGVLIASIEKTSILEKTDIRTGDVIIACEGKAIMVVSDLMKQYQNHNWKGRLNLTVFRNQKEMQLTIKTK